MRKKSISLNLMLMMVDMVSTKVAVAFRTSLFIPSSISSTVSLPRNPTRACMGASSVGTPFCAEAFLDKYHGGNDKMPMVSKRLCDVNIRRLDRGGDKLGYDVLSARGWMEHIEQCDGPLKGVGAYTVIRCDAVYNQHKFDWKIWGLEFHTSRLCSSYKMLLSALGVSCSTDSSSESDPTFEESKRQTNDVITSLLEEAKNKIEEGQKEDLQDLEAAELVRALMLTVLWTTPEAHRDKGAIPIIRGHAAFAGTARDDRNVPMPSAISACVAIPTDPTYEALAMLPRRHSDDCGDQSQLIGASAKISSWCRVRRPLEDPLRFKVPGSGVGEVLLLNQISRPKVNDDQRDFIDSLEILEGLTSNLFVIYKDGTVRTAPTGKVLSGYARHLVVKELKQPDSSTSHTELVLDETAPAIEDARKGLWSEVFVTSSIRLIVPVNKVIIPPIGGAEAVTLWHSDSDEQSPHPMTCSIWAAICRSHR